MRQPDVAPAAARPSDARDDRRHDPVGEIAAGIARELRPPLLAISSAAQLLRFRVADDPVVEKNVGRILREVERLNGFASALLDYASPTARQLALVDPDALWDEVLEQERGRLESRAILLQRTRAGSPARCSGDAARLRKLFGELLENASDAAPEGSDLTLASSVLPDGAWQCRLHNGGAPIPAEALPRLFELFFSTRAGRAGVGLALCRRIVEEHGGTIGIENAPDSGVTVTLELPATPPDVRNLTSTRSPQRL
jgi:two-component system, NtrC family, sensor histidine kinase HydH